MKHLLLVALLATNVSAQPKLDADAGVVLIPSEQFLMNEKACAAAEAERDSLKAAVATGPAGIPVWLTVVIGVAALGAGAALGFGLGPVLKSP